MSVDERLTEIEQKRLRWKQMRDEGTLSADAYEAMMTASLEEERLLNRAEVINPGGRQK